MPQHLSLRLAWHNEGWNGEMCKDPKSNIYCVGRYSYPGDRIKEIRKIEAIEEEGSQCFKCMKVNGAAPCAYSFNAFGSHPTAAFETPPDFFRGGADGRTLDVPPNTAFVWPYEEMYRDEVKAQKGSGRMYDYDKRIEYADKFFKALIPGSTLVFYYVNKSNPFSTEDALQYVLVGISRLKKVGSFEYYDNVSDEIKKKYADGFIWQKSITSDYPDQGFRIPLQKYQQDPEILEKLLFVPEQNYNFKYAARHISDDDALIYVERFLEIVKFLQEIGDQEENWVEREKWLQSVISELWKERGAFPGLSSFLSMTGIEFTAIAQYYKQQTEEGHSKASAANIFAYLNNKRSDLPGYEGKVISLKEYRNTWLNHFSSDQKKLIEKVLIRFHLTPNQFERILQVGLAEEYSIVAEPQQLIENPYLLCEQYVGEDIGDEITFNRIDHGIIPSPELGVEPLLPKNDPFRLRALVVQTLQRESKHTFVLCSEVIQQVNNRLSYYPDWKKTQYTINYILNNRNLMEEAIKIRSERDVQYLYLRTVWQDERLIEQVVNDLLTRPENTLVKPFTVAKWNSILFLSNSELATAAPEEYRKAIQGQIEVCASIFTKPISVVSGGAGTGKTTVIEKIMTAIENSSGNTESFCLLAPTGKAADRIREKTQKEATTIHSFLARRNWLRKNFTYRMQGGKRETDFSTYIIDETSMLDLSLFAAFVRSVNWDYCRRLILVGDPNQLPPIGRGKVFDDIINHLKEVDSSNLGVLKDNLRQLLNNVTGNGNGILTLADMYIQQNLIGDGASEAKARAEATMTSIQLDEFDKDVDFIIWQDAEDLEKKLKDTISLLRENSEKFTIDSLQIISPYRAELYGTDHINNIIQQHLNGQTFTQKGHYGGITLFDKVIQFVNRAGKNAYYSFNTATGKKDRVDVFNGEIGRVYYHLYDKKEWKKPYYTIRNSKANGFQVRFGRRKEHCIEFNSDPAVEENIELAYSISVHKAQGSEFETIFLVIPQSKQTLLSPELIYTGITRARSKLFVFIEKDYSPLINLRRPERSHLRRINASTFEFKPLPQEWLYLERQEWFKEGRIHSTLTEYMVRSKSEVIIANLLHQNELDFEYERRLQAPDGSYYLPDFTIIHRGRKYYWEHLGMLQVPKYRHHWETKKAWYEKFFPDQLLTTVDDGELTKNAQSIIDGFKQL